MVYELDYRPTGQGLTGIVHFPESTTVQAQGQCLMNEDLLEL